MSNWREKQWLENDRNRRGAGRVDDLLVHDNLGRIDLTAEDEQPHEPMPVLRENWMELNTEYHVWLGKAQSVDRQEGMTRWEKIFDRLIPDLFPDK